MNLLNLFRHRRPGEPETRDYPSSITIYIDCERLAIGDMTIFCLRGDTLRMLGGVSTDRDIWIQSPGLEQDVKVEDADEVRLYDGMRLFSTPRYINNG